jgi:hypothetical protein
MHYHSARRINSEQVQITIPLQNIASGSSVNGIVCAQEHKSSYRFAVISDSNRDLLVCV